MAPPEASAVPPELRELPQYEDVRKLGGGGMGVVYLARNRLMDRPEVLKVLSPHLADEEAGRFLREIRAAARLDHPNIVRAHAAFQAGERVVFVMEHVEGEDLDKVVKARGPLPVVEACRFARQVALGLQHAHEKGLIHRDIKPHNLILAPGGVVKILDFGLAKATREQGGTGYDLTGTGEALGTLAYMAPEQARDAARADIRADLYSLGCTLYCLLAGRPPFQARNPYELLRAHQEQEALPLHQVRADVPAELAAVVAKLLAKEPGRRYQQPAEVAQTLESFLEGKGQPVAPASRTSGVAGEGAGLLAFGTVDALPAAMASATVVEDRTAMTRPPEEAPAWRARSPAALWSWRWLLGIGVAALLAGALGLWAGGVFRLRTPEGTLVVEVNVPKPEVYVDGDKVTVTWGEGGKTAVVGLRPGTRKVEVKKDGFTVFGEEVELQDGKHRVLTARLVRQAPPEQPQVRPGVPPGLPPEKKAEPPPTPAVADRPRGEKPLLAQAPFDAAKARELQAAWAKYLGHQVEETVDLGGGVQMAFVLIPPGTFTMGTPPAEIDQLLREDRAAKREWFAGQNQREVTITRPFYLGKYEVTRGQFRRFVSAAGYQTEAETDGLGGWGYHAAANKFEGPFWSAKTGEHKGGTKTAYTWKDPGFAQTDQHPVVNVSWADARAFCRWLARRGGGQARLPSEAEWEYACRAGTTTRYHFGDDPEGLAAYGNVGDGTGRKQFPGWTWAIAAADGYVFTAPVGSFRPNPFGLYDMHGNAVEWCGDWYDADLSDLGASDPVREARGSYTARVLRGGSWIFKPWGCRAAHRFFSAPARRVNDIGFRVAFRLD
jgi:formylglycine-generating enzyme required for sulfatase activity/tRNA A-37 threonylcarbamoyl transferase component Bud32